MPRVVLKGAPKVMPQGGLKVTPQDGPKVMPQGGLKAVWTPKRKTCGMPWKTVLEKRHR